MPVMTAMTIFYNNANASNSTYDIDNSLQAHNKMSISVTLIVHYVSSLTPLTIGYTTNHHASIVRPFIRVITEIHQPIHSMSHTYIMIINMSHLAEVNK
jgi:hypothetical protein